MKLAKFGNAKWKVLESHSQVMHPKNHKSGPLGSYSETFMSTFLYFMSFVDTTSYKKEEEKKWCNKLLLIYKNCCSNSLQSMPM